MRGVYTATYRIASLSAAKTLMYLTAPANKVVEILSVSVTNDSNETNEQLRCSIKRVNSLGTPTVSATPSMYPSEVGDQAAGSVVKADVTASEPTYNATLHEEGWASAGGYYYDPLPEERPIVPPSGTIGVYMESTPAAFAAVVRITFREIG